MEAAISAGRFVRKLLRVMPVVVWGVLILSGSASGSEALMTAKKFYESGRYEDAIKKAKSIIAENENEVEAHRILVRATQKFSDDLNHLVGKYTAAVAKTPKSAVKHYVLGYVYDYKNNPTFAMMEYGRARELDPGFPYVNYNIGYINDIKGYKEKAITFYEEEINNNPSFVSSYFNIGKIKFKEKRYEAAIEFFKKVLSIEPDNIAGNNQIGYCYYALSQIGNAMKHWKKTIEFDSKDMVDEGNVFGLIYNAKGLYVRARHQFFRAIKKDPNNPRFRNNLGRSYIDKGISKTFSPKKVKWVKEAIVELKKALEIDSSYFDAMINLGQAYNLSGYQDESIETYQKAVEAFPGSTLALKALGGAYEYIGRYKEAIEYYNKALKIDNSDYVALANLGNCYYKQGMKSSAVDQWDASLKVYPNQPKLRVLINTVFSKSK